MPTNLQIADLWLCINFTGHLSNGMLSAVPERRNQMPMDLKGLRRVFDGACSTADNTEMCHKVSGRYDYTKQYILAKPLSHSSQFIEPTCVYAQWAHVHHFNKLYSRDDKSSDVLKLRPTRKKTPDIQPLWTHLCTLHDELICVAFCLCVGPEQKYVGIQVFRAEFTHRFRVFTQIASPYGAHTGFVRASPDCPFLAQTGICMGFQWAWNRDLSGARTGKPMPMKIPFQSRVGPMRDMNGLERAICARFGPY